MSCSCTELLAELNEDGGDPCSASSEKLEELVSSCTELPSLPAVVCEADP